MSEPSMLNNSKYSPLINRMIENTTEAPVVTEKNVYQEAKPANKPLVRQIVADLLMPGSRIIGKENLLALHGLAQRHKHTLILMEHYGNFDLPAFIHLLEKCGSPFQEIAD